ncbi:MAG: hypothetical protein KGJ93_05015 [Patescibacteria group bacterium]|nr:hypothetical protein [Patescibacteria group bacterium]
MKKILSIAMVAGLFLASGASAQMMGGYGAYPAYGMMGGYAPDENPAVYQQQAGQANAEVGAALQNIYNSQHVGDQSQIDCGKVSDDQFEKLGDAYMSVMLPNTQQHQVMDNMMGGEGSATLRQAHINMGRSFLGCWSNYNGGPAYMPMMGYSAGFNSSTPEGYYPYSVGAGFRAYPAYGMMGLGFGAQNPMFGWGVFGWFYVITMVLVWILLLLGIAALIKWLRHNNK